MKKLIQDNVSKTVSQNKLTTSKLAKNLGKTTDELTAILIEKGYLEIVNKENVLTEKGKEGGGEAKKGRFGSYFLWSDNLSV